MTTDKVAALAAAQAKAWAGSVRRLIAVAPISAVSDETGVGGGHSTPPERRAIREKAARVVDGWLTRDLAALEAAGLTIAPTDSLAAARAQGRAEALDAVAAAVEAVRMSRAARGEPVKPEWARAVLAAIDIERAKP